MTTLIVIRVAHIACCILAFGLPAFELFVLRAVLPTRRLRRATLLACAIALASWLAWLAELASQMSGQPLTQALHPDVVSTVLRETKFGHVWLVRAALAVALLATIMAGRTAWLLPAAVLLSGGLLGSLAWTGHALGAHPEHALFDALHILAAGLWIGMLAPLLWTVHRAVASDRRDVHRAASQAARRFTLPGIVAVATLAASGALNAWWLVGSVSALLDSAYGQLVMAKTVFFVSMLALASTNRWVLLPRLPGFDAAALHLLRISVAFELALGVAVLVLVGILGITPPAAHEHTGHPMHHAM